jgi:hypothetical protein
VICTRGKGVAESPISKEKGLDKQQQQPLEALNHPRRLGVIQGWAAVLKMTCIVDGGKWMRQIKDKAISIKGPCIDCLGGSE